MKKIVGSLLFGLLLVPSVVEAEPTKQVDLQNQESQNRNFERPNFSAWTYLTYMVYSPELKTYFPQEDVIMMRGEVGDVEDIPNPKDSNLIYEKGPKKVTHGKTEQNIKVYYRMKDVKPMGGQVTIKYLTTDGKVLENDTFINGRVDSEYYVSVYDFSSRGYEFSHSTGDPLTGIFDSKKKNIIVYYKPIKGAEIDAAPISIHFVDEKTGKLIADTKTLTGKIDQNYTISKPQIEGYVFKKSDKPLTGKFNNKSSTVSLFYTKKEVVSPVVFGLLTSKYVDERGVEISKSQSEKVEVGKKYVAKAISIKGYKLISDSQRNGVMTKGGKKEIFTYKKEQTTNSQGNYISDGRYVTVTSKGYNTWQNFSWKEKYSANYIAGKTYQAKGRYEHKNGQTYFSLYDEKGVWQGYINAKATKIGNGRQGAYVADGRYVTVTSKGYNTWQNFNWKSKYSANQVTNNTYQAKGKYKHINGSTYLSIYNDKGVWHGYINEKAVKVGNGKQGAYLSDGKTVTITKKNYSMWQNFGWKKKQSTTKLVNRKFVARGRYEHVNGATYYSLYDNKGTWQGYVNAGAVK